MELRNSLRTWWRRRDDDARFTGVLFLVCVIVFAGYGLMRVHLLRCNGYDLGIFDQAVRRYAHFQAPIVTLKGDNFNIFGDHFHPIIALWAPLYWIWDNVASLIVGQALVVAATAFPAWRFIRRHGGGRVAKAFLAAVMLGWPVVALISFDVHEVAFALPLLAWAIDALDRRATVVLFISCVLLLLVREDMGVVVAVIGLVWLAWPRRRRTVADWAAGIGLLLLGFAAFVFVTVVVIPHFAPDGYQYWAYSEFGSGASGAFVGALEAPWKVLWLLFWPPAKTLTWLALLIPLALLPLRSPYALIALPIMAERMLATRTNLWGLWYHYNAPVWIILALAAVDGYGRLPERWRAKLRVRALALTVVDLAVGVAVVVSLVVVQCLGLPSLAARRAAMAYVPADTCVVSVNQMADAFVRTNRVSVPGISQQRADFYVLDWAASPPSVTSLDWTAQQAHDYAISQGFAVVFQSGTLEVLQAADYTGPDVTTCGPDAP